MKRILYVLLFTAIPVLTFAQHKPDNVAIEITDFIKIEKTEEFNEVVGRVNSTFYIRGVEDNFLSVFVYDLDMNLKNKNVIEMKYGKKKTEFLKMVQIEDVFYLFTFYKDKKTKIEYVFHQILDNETLELSDHEVVSQNSYAEYSRWTTFSYFFRKSLNGKYLMMSTFYPGVKEKKSHYDFVVYGANMESIWDYPNYWKETTREEEKKYEFVSMEVDNQGNVWQVQEVSRNKDKLVDDEIYYTLQVDFYSKETQENTILEPELEGNFITQLHIQRIKNGEYKMVGFYTDKLLNQKGVFNITYDQNFTKMNEELTEFPSGFIVQEGSERAKKKSKNAKDKGKENLIFEKYYFKELIENTDGSFTMLAEPFYSNSYGGEHPHTYYHYGNVVVVNFEEDGSVNWMDVIPKKQSTKDRDDHGGYVLMLLSNGDLAFIYNDRDDNANYEETGTFGAWRGVIDEANVAMYVLDSEGKGTRSILFSGEEVHVLLKRDVRIILDDDELVFVASTRKRYKMVKLTFKF